MRNLLLVAAVALSTAGCGIIYKQPIYQGNLIKQTAVEQLQVGQSKQQVSALLGTPRFQTRSTPSAGTTPPRSVWIVWRTPRSRTSPCSSRTSKLCAGKATISRRRTSSWPNPHPSSSAATWHATRRSSAAVDAVAGRSVDRLGVGMTKERIPSNGCVFCLHGRKPCAIRGAALTRPASSWVGS